jgi:RHS repeat-associated protein
LYIAGLPGAHAFYQTDASGNVTALINDKQFLVAKYAYDPYGNQLSLSGPLAAANVYRFCSKEFLQNSGLSYYGRRFYSPSWQRWLNRDPIGERGGPNLFAFSNNSPLNSLDPFGLDSSLWEDFWDQVYANGLEDASKYLATLGQSALGLAFFAEQAVSHPEEAIYNQVIGLSGQLGTFSGDPSSYVQNAWAAAKTAVTTSDGIAKVIFGLETVLAGGFVATEAEGLLFMEETAAGRALPGLTPGELLPGGTGRAFAGHGIEAGFDGGFGTVTVPEGTSIMIPGTSGTMIPDALGRAIEAGDWEAVAANPEWAEIMEGSATYLPGSTVPNLILRAAEDLNMLEKSIRVLTDTPLSKLLKPGMGPMDWAACRQVF